jgi:peptidoglycan hydrolase CwlO-like protein
MKRNILLAVLLAFSIVSMAAPADKVKADKVVVTAKKQVKKAEPKKEAPVEYKKPTRKKVVKK